MADRIKIARLDSLEEAMRVSADVAVVELSGQPTVVYVWDSEVDEWIVAETRWFLNGVRDGASVFDVNNGWSTILGLLCEVFGERIEVLDL